MDVLGGMFDVEPVRDAEKFHKSAVGFVAVEEVPVPRM